MTSTKYLLVGGGLASNEAIKSIRKKDSSGAITLVSDERHLPYDRPPLTKEFLQGKKPAGEIFLSPTEFYRENNVQAILGKKVESLDLGARSASLAGGEKVSFEKLLLATGGTPIRLSLPGADLKGLHYLRTLDDAEALRTEAGAGKRAVLIGAGFIGIEAAASLSQLGVQVSVVEMEKHIWSRFADESLAGYFQRYCEARGVRFLTGETAAEIRGRGRVASVATRSGKEVPCDFVCIAVGIRPNIQLAQAAGLEVTNGVVVNERLQTSLPDVFAAGDIVNYPDPIFGKRRRVEHWGHAEYCGQVAGQNMAGGDIKYDLLTYVWSDIFDLHLEFAGDESEHDQTVVRGRMEENSFTVLYLKEGRLRAYFAVNTEAKEFPVYQRFIRRKKDLSGLVAQLEDPAANLRSLL